MSFWHNKSFPHITLIISLLILRLLTPPAKHKPSLALETFKEMFSRGDQEEEGGAGDSLLNVSWNVSNANEGFLE